jgi:hypothetical protein
LIRQELTMTARQMSLGPEVDDPRRTLDDLVSRALAYRSGPELKELFEFSRKFPHFAPYNAMLLHVQNRGIQYALSARRWEALYQRRVKPGGRPYVVLRTMGPVDFVFDLSDTEPMDPRHDLVPPAARDPFAASGELDPAELSRLERACFNLGIEVEKRDLATGGAGRVSRVSRNGFDFHLLLNMKHSPVQQLGTLAHELGHVFCGHLGMTKLGFWPDRVPLDKMVVEFEAESVAYLIALRRSLEIGSDRYLSDYLKPGVELPAISLEAILKAAGKIEEMLGGRFRPHRTRRASP